MLRCRLVAHLSIRFVRRRRSTRRREGETHLPCTCRWGRAGEPGRAASEEALGGFCAQLPERVAAPAGLPSLQATNLECLQANRFRGRLLDYYVAHWEGNPAVNIVAKPKVGWGGKSGRKLGRIVGRWCFAAHHWRTGWPPLERTGWPRQAGLGPRNPHILGPQHCAGRVEEDCGDLSSKYAAGRQPGAGGWESTGARGAAGSGGWPTFALTPTSHQTGPGQNQAFCELEGTRSKKSCSRVL